MSTFNFDSSTTLFFFDKANKMVLTQNPGWNPNGDNGMTDAIGRNLDAMQAWGEEEIEVDGETMLLQDWLMEGILDCWELKKRKTWIGRLFKGKYYYQGHRYPHRFPNEVGLSRDHLTYTILAMCYMDWSEKEIWDFVKKLKWRISDVAFMTIDLRLWTKAVSGRRLSKWFYNVIGFITTVITTWFQLKIEKFLGFGPHFEERNEDFHYIQNESKPNVIRKLRKLLYPTYAMKIASDQISYITSKKWKQRFRNQFLKIVPKYNWLIQLQIYDFDGPNQEDVDNYKPMLGDRWSGDCNKWWNDRQLQIIPDNDPLQEYNQLDVDQLKNFYLKYGIN